MALTSLIFLTFAVPVGVVYLYLGILRNDYVFAAGGAALALFPFFVSDAGLLTVLFVVLTAAPFAVRKVISKRGNK